MINTNCQQAPRRELLVALGRPGAGTKKRRRKRKRGADAETVRAASDADRSNPFKRTMRGGWVDPSTLALTANGFPSCRWCKGDVLPPKRTFCCANCVHEHRLRTRTAYMRDCVYRRDRGICVQCKTDTKSQARQVIANPAVREALNVPRNRRVSMRKWGGNMWDMDHVHAVVDGGGVCGLENMRTLCIACHKAVTAAQRTAAAAKRRRRYLWSSVSPVKATFALIATMLLLGTRATLRASAATPDLSGYITGGLEGVVEGGVEGGTEGGLEEGMVGGRDRGVERGGPRGIESCAWRRKMAKTTSTSRAAPRWSSETARSRPRGGTPRRRGPPSRGPSTG